jgi:DNA-binding transcriptional regulator LsrR (DeoR family)
MNLQNRSGQTVSAYEVAKGYWSLKLPRDFKQLLSALDIPCHDGRTKPVTNALGEIVRDWEAKGLVHHHVFPNPSESFYLLRHSEMEDTLRREFRLRAAVVVDISPVPKPKQLAKQSSDEWNTYDDLVHKNLGKWSGRLLASALRPSDVIGIGGGRGPHYTAEFCRVPLGDRAMRYTGPIVSLTGQISTHSWDADKAAAYFDADLVAAQLRSKISSKGKLVTLDCPIVARKRPNPSKVTVAIVGIGALGGGHRLKNFEGVPDLEPVKSLLKQINDSCELVERGNSAPFVHPVGDVCNHYFLVDSTRAYMKASAMRSLNNLLTKLNNSFVNVHPDQLAAVCERGICLGVAGGPHKWAAIEHLLHKNKECQTLTHLITDHETAEYCVSRIHKPLLHQPRAST